MADDSVRVTVRVPVHQDDAWRDHADELGMSRSEFVRTMVQAGRRGFTLSEGSETADPAETPPPAADPRGDGLEERVLAVLRQEGHLEWPELVEALTGDFEDDLERALDELQAADQVRYSGRRGGYAVVDDGQ